MDIRSRASALFAQHRRKIALVVAVIGLAVVGAQVLRQLPTDTHIRYHLGPEHSTVKEVRVAFMHGDEVTVRSLSRRFPNGAPETFEDTVSLTRGTYRVHALLIREAGQVDGIMRGIELPSESVVTIDLFRRRGGQ